MGHSMGEERRAKREERREKREELYSPPPKEPKGIASHGGK